MENLEVKGLEGSLVPRPYSRAGRAWERGYLESAGKSSISCFVYVREKEKEIYHSEFLLYFFRKGKDESVILNSFVFSSDKGKRNA